jgi:hypothetical protein
MRAIKNLPTAAETRSGYERSKFRLWVDANGDCQDTRAEVLAAESLVRVRGCDIQTGKWRSYYDGVVTRDSTAFDIDHLVPLAEAWDSGARGWSADTRERYANDLGDPRTLVAVTAGSNRSKSDVTRLSGCPRARSANTSGSGWPSSSADLSRWTRPKSVLCSRRVRVARTASSLSSGPR